MLTTLFNGEPDSIKGLLDQLHDQRELKSADLLPSSLWKKVVQVPGSSHALGRALRKKLAMQPSKSAVQNAGTAQLSAGVRVLTKTVSQTSAAARTTASMDYPSSGPVPALRGSWGGGLNSTVVGDDTRGGFLCATGHTDSASARLCGLMGTIATLMDAAPSNAHEDMTPSHPYSGAVTSVSQPLLPAVILLGESCRRASVEGIMSQEAEEDEILLMQLSERCALGRRMHRGVFGSSLGHLGGLWRGECPAGPPTCLPTCLSACLPACLPACLGLPAHLPASSASPCLNMLSFFSTLPLANARHADPALPPWERQNTAYAVGRVHRTPCPPASS